MAGGGNYVRPSVKIKKDLQKLYEDNKPLFEIGGILLVFTGLMLNIPVSTNFVGQCLRILQFFSLAGSLLILMVLMLEIIAVLIQPLIDSIENQKRLGRVNEPTSLLRVITTITFPLSILFFFLLTLTFYLVFSFTREFLFLIAILMCHVFIYYFASRLGQGRKITLVILALFLLVLPAFFYFVVFFPDIFSNMFWGVIRGFATLPR